MSGREGLRKVAWGAGPVALLVPQRRPFLFLDRITGFELGAAPTLLGSRFVTANEPVFDGHFPSAPVWPGVLTIEGLAQASGALSALVDAVAAHGEAAVVAGFELVEAGATLSAGRDEVEEARFRALLSGAGRGPGVFGGADVRLFAPVFPGCRLDYRVTLERQVGDLIRIDAEATVDGRRVAAGRLSGGRR